MSAVALEPDASRQRPGFLTPSSEGSLNCHDEASSALSSEGRKRKRSESVAMDLMLKQPIAVKPHPSNLQSQPRMLLPLMLVSRKHLPLSFFDLASPSGEFVPSRFYQSHVKILDLESRMTQATTPNLLIARYESRGTVYALERQDDGLYVVCKVGSWVDLEKLSGHASVRVPERIERPQAAAAAAEQESKPEQRVTLRLTESQKAKRQAIESIQSLVRKKARTSSVSLSSVPAATTPAVKVEGTATEAEPEPAEEKTAPPPQQATTPQPPTPQPPTPQINSLTKLMSSASKAYEEQCRGPDKIFDNIRTHYFEALYKSKGSLAYFAKGPLSRARSAFSLDLESNLDMNDLLDFLKSLLLTTVQIDKKYRETFPALIANMQHTVDTSDEGRKRRRKPKKMKLGKDCLYPQEDDSIRQWWSANKPELKEEETAVSPQQVKTHASMLRTRETLLQMIIILEVVALEPKAAEQAAQSLPTLPGAADSPDKMAPPPKKRNKHNLPVLLDVHADRLTIWQSTASDEQILLEDSQVPQAMADGQPQQKSSEPLKDFCVDVIIPFFSARLPQLCDGLSRKLGGPVIIAAPAKAKSSKPKRDQKPGAAAKRAEPRREMSLQRALSYEQNHRRSLSRGPSSALTLMRSTSAASIPSVKREGSEPPRPGSKEGAEATRSRTSTLSRSSSAAGLQDAKAMKKAKVEAELKDAISALRKPNRQVVGKAMTEEARRKATVTRSARKPSRAALGSSILVKATPANNRFKDAMAAASVADTPLPSTEEAIPPSSIGLVPSTAQKAGGSGSNNNRHLDNGGSPAYLIGGTPVKTSSRAGIFDRRPAGSADVLDATPVRPKRGSTFIRRPANEEPALPPSSPIAERKGATATTRLTATNAVFETPAKRTTIASLFETPVRRSAPRPDDDDHLGGGGGARGVTKMEESPEKTKKKASIYDKLGWDDDDLDDLV
ncbi:hypothetical protein N3K66_001412 [Trichothecium roseum]|uniref:Uncharacterized protein n=1 Tax=Trichothecium roseum TaxID=47278 RepID=A0ACC0VHG0_9HYPO|nr:hypothetical protein N3K66_001412 [Trichothecium roseum]